MYERKTAGGNPRGKKGGAGNRNWGNNQEEVVAQDTNAEQVLNNVEGAEGKEEVVVEEEDLGPPTKSFEEFQAERKAALVQSDRAARGKRNAGFAGKKVVSAPHRVASTEKKSSVVTVKSNTISLDQFDPKLAERSPFQQEQRPRRDNNGRGRGEGRGRGRGQGRGGRGRGRGNGARRNNKLDLKNDRAFPALGQ